MLHHYVVAYFAVQYRKYYIFLCAQFKIITSNSKNKINSYQFFLNYFKKIKILAMIVLFHSITIRNEK